MQLGQYEQEQLQTSAYQCNLCLRKFSTNHGKKHSLGTCRKRFPGLHGTQSQPAQQIRDQVSVNVNIDAEMQPTSSPSPKKYGEPIQNRMFTL
jgi:hypothetical protein